MEPRQLLAATLIGDISDISITSAFDQDMASAVTGTVVKFDSTLGSFQVEMFDDITPLTVANFLNYVDDGSYNNATDGDTIIHRSVSGFVVQGGGFSWKETNSTTHEGTFNTIPTDPPVANEFTQLRNHFGPTAHINTRGRIAMAKLGGDPNSATSQWFFNLADNSSNLDNQNGGFTTFGQVLYNGMSVVDAIAAVKTFDKSSINGAFSQIPLRNYTVPTTGDPPAIKTANVVRFTGISVVGRPTYTIDNDHPELVTVTMEDGQVHVHSEGTGSGLAHITVTASGAGADVVESFEVLVNAPDTVHFGPATFAENDGTGTALVPITLSHIPVDHALTLHYSTTAGTATPGLDYSEVTDGTILFPQGQTTAFASVPLIDDSELEFNETFTLNFPASEVNSLASTPVTIDDDEGVQSTLDATHPVSFIDFDNDRVMINLVGEGTGTVVTPADGTAGDVMLDLEGTTADSSLHFGAREGDGRVGVGFLQVSGPIGSISGPVVLSGDLTVTESLGSLRLSEVAGPSTISIGTGLDGEVPTSIRIDQVVDLSILSASPIASLRVGGWEDSDGDDVLTGTWIGTLRSNGAFAPDLTISGDGLPAGLPAVQSARIGGTLGASTWDLTGGLGLLRAGAVGPAWELMATGAVGQIRVRGDFSGDIEAPSLALLSIGGNLSDSEVELTADLDPLTMALGRLSVRLVIDGSTIRTIGNMGIVTGGAMRHSAIFAGIDPGLDDLPDSADDFANDAMIQSLVLHGIRGDVLQTYIDSDIAAATVGRAALGTVDPVNGSPFGVAAKVIGPANSVTWRIGDTAYAARTADELAAIAFDDDFIVRLV